MSELQQKWSKTAAERLVGRKITATQYVDGLLLIELDDGTQIAPMCDDEGNGPGALHGATKKDESFILPVVS